MLDINPLLIILFANIFSHSLCCLFNLSMISFVFKYNEVPFAYVCFYFHLSRKWVKNIFLKFMSKSVLPMFSSMSFIESGLIFIFIVYFEIIFVYDVIECSYFILLQAAIQFSKYHLLKRHFALHCIILPLLS